MKDRSPASAPVHGDPDKEAPRDRHRGPLPGRREMVAMALGWPACVLAVRRARAAVLSTAPGRPPSRPGRADAVETETMPLPLTAEDRVYLATTLFEQGYHCAQSVLGAYTDEGLSETTALRMGTALAGGSTVGGECGAVAAGYLILGLRHGSTTPTFGDVEKDRALFDRIRRLVEAFRGRHGAITCRELLGVDVFSSEGLAEGRRRGLFRQRCPQYVRDVIQILESLG